MHIAKEQRENLTTQLKGCILYQFLIVAGNRLEYIITYVIGSSWKQIGPLPCTPNGNKYTIVVTDYFSKWPTVMFKWKEI